MPTKPKSFKKPSAPASGSVITVSEVELAAMLAVTDRRVRQMADEGLAKRNGPATYDLGATLRAVRLDRLRTSKHLISVAKVTASFVEAVRSAREEQINNPTRDPLTVVEGDFLTSLMHG